MTLLKKHTNIIIILLFAIMFFFGLFFLKDINANFDEFTEQDILRGNLMQYADNFGLYELSDYFSNQGVIPIKESVEIDHGVSPYYVFAPLLLVKYVSPHYLSVLWHLYTYSIYFIGVVFFYKLIKYLFKKESVAFLSTILYFISPRILIDSLHNNKDVVLMSLLVVMIYLGIRFIKERSFKIGIAFAIISGIECNIKILGFYFLFIIGFSYIIRLFIDRKFNRRNFFLGFLTAVLSLLVFGLLTPAVWGNVFEYIEYCLNNSVNFRATTNVLFEGAIYNKAFNPLPWYYVPKYILMTLPSIVVILFVFGIVRFARDNFKKSRKWNMYYINTILAIYLIPLIICLISRPNLYNGWRHFYFLYSGIMIFVAYIINYFISSRNRKIIFTISFIVCISISASVISLHKYGVANTSYFNMLYRNKVEGKYELDYYGVTTKAAIDGFLNEDLEYDSEHKIYLYGEGFNLRVISDYLRNANIKSRNHIIMLDEQEYKRRIEENKTVYLVCNSVYTPFDTSRYRVVYNYKYANNSIIKFYKI